jgi:hypothetical protein
MSGIVQDLLGELVVDLNYECEVLRIDKSLKNVYSNYIEINSQGNLVVKDSPCANADDTRSLNGVSFCRPCYRIVRMYQRLYKDLIFRRDTIKGIEFLRWDVNNLTARDSQG